MKSDLRCFVFFFDTLNMVTYKSISLDCTKKKKKKKKTKEEEEEEEEILFIIFFAWCKRRSDARKWCAVDTTRA